MDIHFEVIEYSKYGFGRLDDKFPTFDDAVEWVDKAQNVADLGGNPTDLCYDVVPAGTTVYTSISKVTTLHAVA
jgi:hypothetical protein